MSQNLKQKVLSGVFWQGISNVLSTGVTFVISVVLARLLTPHDFGTVAIVGIFTSFMGVFILSGFSAALVQKKQLEPEDCSSVFFLNLAVSLLTYVILYFSAPVIADFYGDPKLTLYVRIISLTLLMVAFVIVPRTIIYREMKFALRFRIDFSTQIIGGSTGLIMAFCGAGVWALVAQSLVGSLVSVILYWLWGKWRPVWVMDFARLREMFRFGWKMFCSGILDTLYNNVYGLLVGKLYNLSTLAYYNRGHGLPAVGMGIINGTLGSVLFPAFSSIQDDKEMKRNLMQRAIKNIQFLVIPAMTLLGVLAEPVVLVIYGEKWLPAVPYMQIFCFSQAFYPLHTTNLQLLTACGRSDVFLILEIIKKVQVVIVILLTYKHGPLAMAAGLAASAPLGFIENAWMSKKLANYSFVKQTLDQLPILLCAVIAGISAFFAIMPFENTIAKLAAGIPVFAIVYLLASILLKQFPEDVVKIIKSRFQKFRKRNCL